MAASCGRLQAPGSLLCATDTRRLGDWIARIGDEYERLSAVPSMQQREPGTGGRSGLASQRSVGRLDVIALRDKRGRDRDDTDPDGNATRGVLEVLGSWAILVREERGIEPSTVVLTHRRQAAPPGPVCDLDAPPCGHHTCWAWTFRTVVFSPATVPSERKVLAVHLDWIVTQDWVDELFADMSAIWRQVQAQNNPGNPRGYVALCGCGGRIRWGDGAAVCQGCGTRTTGLDVVRKHAEGAVA